MRAHPRRPALALLRWPWGNAKSKTRRGLGAGRTRAGSGRATGANTPGRPARAGRSRISPSHQVPSRATTRASGARRRSTQLRKIDAATVAGYYGSDSAGTFVTAVAILTSMSIAFEQYMPVLLAVMEIPGCLVALLLVSRLRQRGLDAQGNARNESGYDTSKLSLEKKYGTKLEKEISLEKTANEGIETGYDLTTSRVKQLLHEIFLNPGIYLLFGGIIIGFVSQGQNSKVVAVNHTLFVTMFQGILCFFLFNMGIIAAKRLHDLKNVGFGFIVFALLAPNLFAFTGIILAHFYSLIFGLQFSLGTYVLFGVLCGSASYIAVPAVQRLAIPEASSILPLAASLGLTFSYNVTIGIPLYIAFARLIAI